MMRATLFYALLLLGCGGASELPDLLPADGPQTCPLDDACGDEPDGDQEIKGVPPPDGGAQ